MPSPRVNPPALLRHWQTWTLMMAFLLVPFFIKIPVSLRRNAAIGVLGDRLHIVFLAIITLLLYWKGPLRGRLLWAAVATAAIGGAIEFVQTLVGRQALWHDFFMDMQGIGLIVGFILWRGHRKIIGLIMVAGLVVYITWQISFLPGLVSAVREAEASFPLLSDFNSPTSSALWKDTYHADVKLSFEEEGVLQISGGPPSSWPGAEMANFPHDWTDYKELVVDARVVRSPTGKAKFALRLDDFQGRLENCWVTDGFWANQQWTTYTMPLVGRELNHCERILDLSDVDKVLLFLPSPKDSVLIEFDNLHLR